MILNLQSALLSSANKPGSLLFRHPEYTKRWRAWEFGRISYLGGREYLEPTNYSIEFQEPILGARDEDGQSAVKSVATRRLRSLLYRHGRETTWEFFNRTQRAYYYNFVKSVVNSLVSHATKRGAQRDGDDLSKRFWDGVDVSRTQTISQYVRTGLRWTCAKGIMWTCVDARAAGDVDTAASKVSPVKDDQPYAYWVSPLDVLDWEVDEYGQLVWLKQFKNVTGKREWNQGIDQRFQFLIWHRDRVETWETNSKGGAPRQLPTRSYAHLNRVPWEPLYLLRDEAYDFPDGKALVEDLCKGANHVFNLCSLLSEILYKQTFSLLTIPDKRVDVMQVGITSAVGYDPGVTGGARPEFLSPDADQARVFLESIGNTISELRQSMGVGRGRSEGSMQKSAAESQELESEDKRSILGDIAASAEDFERRLDSLVTAYRKQKPSAETSIEYSREFDVRALKAEVDEALSFEKLGISPEVKLEMVEQLVRRKFAGMPPKKQDALVATLKAHVEKMAAQAEAIAGAGEPGQPGQGDADPEEQRLRVIASKVVGARRPGRRPPGRGAPPNADRPRKAAA